MDASFPAPLSAFNPVRNRGSLFGYASRGPVATSASFEALQLFDPGKKEWEPVWGLDHFSFGHQKKREQNWRH